MPYRHIYRAQTYGPFKVLEANYRPHLRMPPHVDRASRISIVLAGAVREDAGGIEAFGAPASVVAKAGDAAHANLFGPAGALIVSLSFADGAVPAQYRPQGWTWYHGGPVAQAALEFVRTYRTGAAPADAVAAEAYALIGALPAHGAHPVRAAQPPVWLQRVRDHIREVFTQGYSVHGLAQAAGVHPIYLTRQFRRYFGCSVSRYVQRLRVQYAAHLLRTSDVPLAQLALEAGFFDQSHFCRVFRATLGRTPSQFRSLVRAF